MAKGAKFIRLDKKFLLNDMHVPVSHFSYLNFLPDSGKFYVFNDHLPHPPFGHTTATVAKA